MSGAGFGAVVMQYSLRECTSVHTSSVQRRASDVYGATRWKRFGSTPTGCPNGATWALSKKFMGFTRSAYPVGRLLLAKGRQSLAELMVIRVTAGRSNQSGAATGKLRASRTIASHAIRIHSRDGSSG